MSDADPASAGSDALLAARLLAVDPAGLHGACVHGAPAPGRDAWLAFLRRMLPPDEPLRRVPMHISDERLLGGPDWFSALHHGRTAYRSGVLADCDRGFLVLPSSERMPAPLCSRLTACLDTGEIVLQRDGVATHVPARIGVIALDESGDDESPTPMPLLDRLAFVINAGVLGAALPGDAGEAASIVRARARLARVAVTDATVRALCAAAAAVGVDSTRASLMAVHAARAAAALAGRGATNADDARVAARLVLSPRAAQIPQAEPAAARQAGEAAPPRGENAADPDARPGENASADADERVIAAARAVLPAHLFQCAPSRTRARRGRHQQGRAGALRQAAAGGRPAGVRAGKPGRGIRLSLVETLRAAAPWQRLRREAAADPDARRLRIRAADLRTVRYKQRTRTVTIFVVDASGSAALNRMAEAKGAVELLLADCYVRRDQVCVIAFRGVGAELILPPTRSLARARRHLAGLPGGGATPLAAALQLAGAVAERSIRAGHSVTQVVLTDGSANVALDGSLGRQRAEADVRAVASGIRAQAIPTILIDISQRAQRSAESLAQALGARYLWLPRADAAAISGAVRLSHRQVS